MLQKKAMQEQERKQPASLFCASINFLLMFSLLFLLSIEVIVIADFCPTAYYYLVARSYT
jgi:hypothetical protein